MAISTPVNRPAQSAAPLAAIPPLENGDQLTRDEFERRYDSMPDLKGAELVEGVVYMPSAVRHGGHSNPHSCLIGWLWIYAARTPGLDSGDNGSIRLDLANMPQPDAYLIIRPERGGQARISVDDYIDGAPELIAEIASSSASYDLGSKLEAYCRNRVREYIVWRVLDREVDWFVLRDGKFERLAPEQDGTLRSTVFPGLWLDPAALVRGDSAGVLAVVQNGIDSPDHSEFLARLGPAPLV
jgi:Uma2 family endonuclease